MRGQKGDLMVQDRGLIWDSGWLHEQLVRQAISTHPTATYYTIVPDKTLIIPAGITKMLVESELAIKTTDGSATYNRNTTLEVTDVWSTQQDTLSLPDYSTVYEDNVIVPFKVSMRLSKQGQSDEDGYYPFRPGEKRVYRVRIGIAGAVANSVIWARVRLRGYKIRG
jgi:hypothetical protein